MLMTYGGIFEDYHPLTLLMKANSEDNPTWNMAMRGIHSSSYWKAMELEKMIGMKSQEQKRCR